MDPTLKLKIDAETGQAVASVEQLDGALRGATGDVKDFGTASGETGGKVDALGEQVKTLAGQMAALAGVAGIADAFKQVVSAGIEFNDTMERTRSGLAALINASMEFRDASGQVVTGAEAMGKSFEVAEGLQKRLLESAKSSPAAYQDLVQAFQAAFGPAMAAGVTNLGKLEKVVVAASQAVGALGLDSRQTTQELRAMFAGEQGPDNQLNRALGITKEKLDAVRASGSDVGDFFLNKLKPFSDAAAQSLDNFATVTSNLRDNYEQLAGEFAKPVFAALGQEAKKATGDLGDVQKALGDSGRNAAEMVHSLAPLGKSLVEMGATIAKVAIEAGAHFQPLIPVIKAVVDIVTVLVDKFGATAIQAIVLQKGIGALVGAFEGKNAILAKSIDLFSRYFASFKGGAAQVESLAAATKKLGEAKAAQATATAGAASSVERFGAVALVASFLVDALSAAVQKYHDRQAEKAEERAAEGLETYRKHLEKVTAAAVSVADATKLIKMATEDKIAILKLAKEQHISIAEAMEKHAAAQLKVKEATEAASRVTKELLETEARKKLLVDEDLKRLREQADAVAHGRGKVEDLQKAMQALADKYKVSIAIIEDMIKAQQKEAEETKKAADAISEKVKSLADLADRYRMGRASGEEFRAAMEKEAAGLKMTKEELGELVEKGRQELEWQKEHRSAAENAAEADKQYAQAAEAAAKKTGELAEKRRGDAEAAREQAGAAEQVADALGKMTERPGSAEGYWKSIADGARDARGEVASLAEAAGRLSTVFDGAKQAVVAFQGQLREASAEARKLGEDQKSLLDDLTNIARGNDKSSAWISQYIDELEAALARGGKSWQEQSRIIDDFQKKVQETFGWMQDMNTEFVLGGQMYGDVSTEFQKLVDVLSKFREQLTGPGRR